MRLINVATCIIGLFVAVSRDAFAESIEAEFERRYLAWKESVNPNAYLQSTARGRVDNLEFQAIVDLGPSALPHIVAKMESDATGDVLWHAIRRIAKVRIREKYDASTNSMHFPDYPELKKGVNVYLHWWRVGRFQTGARFKELYVRWCGLDGEKKHDDAGKVYRQIVNLGIPVLPYLVGVVDEHPEFVVAVAELSGGDLPKNAKPEECKAWWEKHKERYTLPPEPSGDGCIFSWDSTSMSPDATYAPQVKGDDDVALAASMSKELSFQNIHSIERPVFE